MTSDIGLDRCCCGDELFNKEHTKKDGTSLHNFNVKYVGIQWKKANIKTKYLQISFFGSKIFSNSCLILDFSLLYGCF